MAKKNFIKIRLNSSAGTGAFYVTKRNPRPSPKSARRAGSHYAEKLTLRKYDPKLRKHVEFKEGKIK